MNTEPSDHSRYSHHFQQVVLWLFTLILPHLQRHVHYTFTLAPFHRCPCCCAWECLENKVSNAGNLLCAVNLFSSGKWSSNGSRGVCHIPPDSVHFWSLQMKIHSQSVQTKMGSAVFFQRQASEDAVLHFIINKQYLWAHDVIQDFMLLWRRC